MNSLRQIHPSTSRILTAARSLISRSGGFTSRQYGDGSCFCMLGAISYVENGSAAFFTKSRHGKGWSYVVQATKELLPRYGALRRKMLVTKCIPRGINQVDSYFPEAVLIASGWDGQNIAVLVFDRAIELAEADEHQVAIDAGRAADEAELIAQGGKSISDRDSVLV